MNVVGPSGHINIHAEQRGVRLDQFMVGAKWMMAIIVIIAVLTSVITVVTIVEARQRTLDSLSGLHKYFESPDQHWTAEDRKQFRKFHEDIRDSLRRIEKQVKK